MKIGELAKRSGLTASRIRFYESAGLLQTVDRQANGYRAYPAASLMVLEIIAHAQRAGFSLDEIRSLLPSAQVATDHGKLVAALEQKIADIEALEKRLSQNKSQLSALIEDIRHRPQGLDCASHTERLLGRMREGISPAALQA